MEDNHEILPAPKKENPQAPNQEGAMAPQVPRGAESEHIASQAIEKPAAHPQGPPPGQATGATGADSSLPPSIASPVQQTEDSTGGGFTGPQVADDVDLIEKEWVQKTKEIVQNTKDDPYNQNKQIVRLRADYMKKRYNKDIKMVED